MAFSNANWRRRRFPFACGLAVLVLASLGCVSPRKATVELNGQPPDASAQSQGASTTAEIDCLAREKLLPVATGGIGPIWPDISKPAPRADTRDKDSAVIVALEGDASAPIRIGANLTARAWSDYFTQTLGVPGPQVHWVSFAGIGPRSVKVALDVAAKQAGPTGRLWVLFIGRGRVGCPSNSPAGARCRPQLWLEVASADQRTPEPREWAFEEMQSYVVQRNAAPVVIVDVVAAVPEQPGQGKATASPTLASLPSPSRGVTFSLVHSVQQPLTTRSAYISARLRKLLYPAGADVTWPLTLAGNGVLPGTSGPAFAQLLLAALRGWADRNADGHVTADEAVQQVREALVKAAPTLSGVPAAMGPGRRNVLVPGAEKQFPVLQAPEPRVIAGQSVLFNAASRVLPEKAGPTASEIDWHMFDDIGDTSRLTSFRDIPIGLNPNEFLDDKSEYERAARPLGGKLRESYEKYPDNRVDTRIGGWCAAANFGRLAPFRHEAWRHCASFVSYASMQVLIWTEIEKDWDQLDRILRQESTSAADGFALLRHFLERYPMQRGREVALDACETTCQRMVTRREQKPRPGADLGSNEWRYVKGSAQGGLLIRAAYEIQRTEVTNAQYDRCVRAGACARVVRDASWLEGASVDPENGAQAVVGVDWNEAKAFCYWVGGDLPTQHQWFDAAFAWEDDSVDPFAWVGIDPCRAVIRGSPHAKCNPLPKGPQSACSNPQSNTPLGLCDMFGNVSEWANDAVVDAKTGNTNRPTEGHNWQYGIIGAGADVAPLSMGGIAPTTRSSTIGFRCVRPAR